MSVYWSLVSHEDRKVLHLGTGRWEETLGAQEDWSAVPPRQASEIRLRLDRYFKTWGDQRLSTWALQIAALMNGRPTTLVNDSFELEERGTSGYKSAGILSGRG
jgi:hypothetical protein